MAHIKCRYFRAFCGYSGRRLLYDELGGYGNEYELCEECPYHQTDSKCNLRRVRECEFEKTSKYYEYEDGNLRIGRFEYNDWEIAYLEIDGRLLVGEEEKTV